MPIRALGVMDYAQFTQWKNSMDQGHLQPFQIFIVQFAITAQNHVRIQQPGMLTINIRKNLIPSLLQKLCTEVFQGLYGAGFKLRTMLLAKGSITWEKYTFIHIFLPL